MERCCITIVDQNSNTYYYSRYYTVCLSNEMFKLFPPNVSCNMYPASLATYINLYRLLGISDQLTSSSFLGTGYGGCHPYVCVYSIQNKTQVTSPSSHITSTM